MQVYANKTNAFLLQKSNISTTLLKSLACFYFDHWYPRGSLHTISKMKSKAN